MKIPSFATTTPKPAPSPSTPDPSDEYSPDPLFDPKLQALADQSGFPTPDMATHDDGAHRPIGKGNPGDYYRVPPVIGAIPFGGIVIGAGRVTLAGGAAPGSLSIGDGGDGKAAGTVIILSAETAGVIEVVPDTIGFGTTVDGYRLPAGTTSFPLRRALVRGVLGGAGGVLNYLVVSFDRG